MSLAAAMMNIQAYVRDMGNVPGYEDDDQLIASAPPVPPDGGSPGMITIGDLRRVVEARALNRWNIEEDGGALLICRGLHEKGEPCEVERYVPEGSVSAPAESFQARVQPWMMACFGEMIAGDREERNHRFLEEALELVQACGCTSTEAHKLVNYVYGREVGEKGQEVGGVMVTLAALCLAQGLDMHVEAETELTRIWTKVEQIRAKQAAKPKHSPLPEATTTEIPLIPSDDAKRAEYLDGRMQHWLNEAQRLAALVTALGGNPEPGAPQPVDPVGQERRRTPNAEFPDGVMDHTRRRLEGIDALWEANGQPDHGQIAFLLRLGRSYVQMPKVDDLARERAEICRALGCVDKPGAPKEFILQLMERLAKAHTREVELIRSWDKATPTERQELDRMRRGWGPSTPTERNRRHNDVKRCLSVLSGAMTELQVGEEEADEISEEARDRIDLAYERLDKRHTEMLAIVEALNKEPMEWPDIKVAEERGAMAMRRIIEERVSGLKIIESPMMHAWKWENFGYDKALASMRDAPLPRDYHGSARDDVAKILANPAVPR